MTTMEWEVLDTSGGEWEVVDGGVSWTVQRGPVEIVNENGGGGLTAEQVRDLVAAFVTAGANVTVTHDDTAGTLTIAVSSAPPSGGAGGALSGSYPNPELNEESVQDLVAAFVEAGDNVTVTHDDTAGTLTIAVTGLATVATTGAYSDLSGRPTLGTAAAQDSSAFDAAGTASSLVTAHTGDTVDAHDASAISIGTLNGNLSAVSGTDVEQALQAVDNLTLGGTVDVVSNVAQNRILGRVTAGSGDSEELTAAQVRSLLGVEQPVEAGFPTLSGGIDADNWSLPPGVTSTGNLTTQSFGTGTAWVTPFLVTKTITITAAAVRATTTASGSVTRCAIVRLNTTLQPTALTHEFATFDTSSSGVKSQTGLSIVLTPGIYATYGKTEVAAPTLAVPTASGISNPLLSGLQPAFSAGGQTARVGSVAIGAGAYADPPAGMSSFSTNGNSFLYLRWTTT